MTDISTIIKLTAAEIAARIASGELTAVEVTEAHLARIDAIDEKVHAFLHIDREGKRNALNGEVLTGMLDALRAPGDARVVLLTSAGDRVFCAGADLVQMAPDATGLEVHEDDIWVSIAA